jgi:hypothetical protein
MADRFGPAPLRTNFRSPNRRVPAEETKKRLWLDQGYLIVDVTDPSLNISWVDREYLVSVATKLYGKRKEVVA